MKTVPGSPWALTRFRLDSMPLPAAGSNDDKNGRGIVLAVGGSDCVPGAILLAGIAALRAGAGKLQMGTVRKAAIALGLSVPEALVLGLPTSKTGEIAASTMGAKLQPFVENANAVLIGPGMSDAKTVWRGLEYLIPHFPATAILVLDGAAIVALQHDSELVKALDGRVVVTPNAGEMATLMDVPKEAIDNDQEGFAAECANRFQVVVALKGGETFIAAPGEESLHYREGKVGLATSGSGDTLAGIVAGLAARGAAPRTAAAWGVWAHGSAGNKLSRSVGKVGFLARELLDEIPKLLNG